MSSAQPRPPGRPEHSDPRPPGRPEPYEKPPRSALGVRQLIGALVVLIPVILLLGGLSRCSFSPGGPSVDVGGGPTVDAPAVLRGIAPRVPFGLRIPAVPPGWRSNAVSQAVVDGARVVRTGYLTPAQRYLRVVQSDAPEQSVLVAEAGAVPPARGTTDAAGHRWVVYGAEGAEPVWVTDVSGVRLLITGSAGEDDFRTLATATFAADPLPPGTAPR